MVERVDVRIRVSLEIDDDEPATGGENLGHLTNRALDIAEVMRGQPGHDHVEGGVRKGMASANASTVSIGIPRRRLLPHGPRASIVTDLRRPADRSSRQTRGRSGRHRRRRRRPQAGAPGPGAPMRVIVGLERHFACHVVGGDPVESLACRSLRLCRHCWPRLRSCGSPPAEDRRRASQRVVEIHADDLFVKRFAIQGGHEVGFVSAPFEELTPAELR